MKKNLKFIPLILLFLISAAVLLFIISQYMPAPQIIINFTQIEKIEKISKFRSCAGHTTVPQDMKEMKRNMKHYFWVKPEYLTGNNVEIYAPFDGFVTGVRSDPAEGLEGEIWIVPKDIFVLLPPIGRWSFSVQHINILSTIGRGSEVKAGQLIGHAAVSASNRQTFDIVFAKAAFAPKQIDNWMGPFTALDSVFNHMSEKVLGEYGIPATRDKDDLITSEDERDSSPCVYKDNGPYFLNQDDAANWELF